MSVKKNAVFSTKEIVMIGLCAAIMCIAGPFSVPIPISPVPISLTPLVVFLSAYILPPKMCTLSTAVYLVLGTIGLPVFSGFTGGVGKIAGPTGGYLIGFLLTAFICSVFNNRITVNKINKNIISIIGMICGAFAYYLFGTVWFTLSQGVSFYAAFTACVLPYLLGDALKIAAALIIGSKLRTLSVK